MTYYAKKPTHRFQPWYRRACAAHERALAAPMPPQTRYVGERYERQHVEKRYLDMIAAQRKAVKR